MPARDQMDKGLEYNGQGTPVSYKQNMKYSGNASGMHSKANYGHKTFAGNASDSGCDCGPSATKDPHQKTIATARQGGVTGHMKRAHVANPDKIRY